MCVYHIYVYMKKSGKMNFKLATVVTFGTVCVEVVRE